jgi:mono/diheme cytochrome c family protein
VTEVPEHLLRRSRERREALGLATGGAPTPSGATPAPSTPVEAAPAAAPAAPAAPATPAAAPAPEAPPEPEHAPPPRPPARVPAWALPVLAALPFWAILYAGAFGERKVVDPNDPAVIGARVYRSAGCSGCHGATGGGGVGPPMAAVKQTFPNEADHVAWIKTGSKPTQGQPYGNSGRVSTGGMPGFEGALSQQEIEAVVKYEREQLAR